MIVAELELTTANMLRSAGFSHRVSFDTLDGATKIYHEVCELLRRRDSRANDLPKLVEIEGSGQRLSLPLEMIQSISLRDYVFSNEQAKGMREAYPNLYSLEP